ncbi:glycerol kinase GlpK [Xanthobacter sp. KR7-65]|uniref:glycerol kinase GlpK n=1 Tax=Xanthobacter sp. KR7-65 TaxID=3156612 RepID=UPI0032B4AC45
MESHILVIDQGTTSTRSIVFDRTFAPVASAQREFPQHFPHPGWVEHDPRDLWETSLATMRDALARAALTASDIAAIGIANQRETTLLWDRQTGEPIAPAIVWQDRRTADLCSRLNGEGCESLVAERSGILIDPYFSATKIGWLLDHVEGARARAERGDIAFGTVDSFLLWRLTGGAVHATDATNASRTMLFDIHSGAWDPDLLRLFDIPAALLPDVRDTAGAFGTASKSWLGREVPVLAVVGDQQASLVGQACFTPGLAKATYGTGAFMLLNTGQARPRSRHRLLTTIAYQWDGKRAYALEGSIFSAGSTVQWLRDSLGIISSAAESTRLAAEADDDQAVYLVPAFTGLGAPHWRSDARATLSGLTRGTTRREIARAALESVGYQTLDLLDAMRADILEAGLDGADTVIRVDGGMSDSDWTMQFLADVLGHPVDRPVVRETTALGAAFLAGWRAGLYGGPEEFARSWHLDRRFAPAMPADRRSSKIKGWQHAVAQALHV